MPASASGSTALFPEVSGPGAVRAGRTVGLYAWHGRHHLVHITRTVEREGW